MGHAVKVETFWLSMDDGAELHVCVWENVADRDGDHVPLAVLQLAHGMVEHIGRYDEFASYVVQRGICVIGSDHRGHGRTGEKAGLLGHFADENGFDRATDDLRAVNEWIGTRYPGVPRFLMGHSMGSMLARRYIQRYADTVDGVVIMGTAGNPGVAGKLGRWLARMEMRCKGARHPSMLLSRLVFGTYNKKVPNPKTAFDWLSRDPEAVADYVADPFCGFVPTAGFYYDLLTGLQLIHDEKFIRFIPVALHILFVSGDADPVGGYGRGVEQVIAQYKRHGLRQVESIMYEGARHELLNETNKDEVYEALYGWLVGQARSAVLGEPRGRLRW